jgi:amino acid adenylation domain-containing protein/non-ribosomal peptide synthase protein (TIGR01720 family)
MNSAAELLNRLASLGVELRTEGAELRWRAPKGVLSPELLEQIRSLKPALLAELRRDSNPDGPSPATSKASQEAPTSFAQQRLWFLQTWDGPSGAYNVPEALRVDGRLNVDALHRALSEMVRRHETLRTVFAERDGVPVQIIAADGRLDFREERLVPPPGEAVETAARHLADAEAQQPFDLTCGPLLRVRLLRVTDDAHYLFATMHHIISDAWSKNVFVKELAECYNAFAAKRTPQLPPLPLQYADYAREQRSGRDNVEEEAGRFWKQYMAGASPLLELPADRPRPAAADVGGAVECFEIEAELYRRLCELGREEHASPFMTLAATFNVFLHRYTFRNDLVIGTHTAGRFRTEWEALIGFFINTLPLRADLSGKPTFRELLGRVRRSTLEAFEHQATPFEQIVEALQPERAENITPVVQVMMVLQNTPLTMPVFTGLTLTPLPLTRHTAKFDLSVLFYERQGSLVGEWEYRTSLFSSTAAKRMVRHFRSVLHAVLERPDEPIAQLPFGDETDRRRLRQWTDVPCSVPSGTCLQEGFEAVVRRQPHVLAVKAEAQSLTFLELNVRANRLAHRLRRMGLGVDEPVGLCTGRSVSLLVGILGIVKAGGAYLPLEPRHPTARLRETLTEAGARILVTDRENAVRLNWLEALTVRVENADVPTEETDSDNPPLVNRPGDLAYVIYTSGSTGQPKGVMIEHCSVVNLIAGLDALVYASLGANPVRISLTASAAFDASVQQIFAAMLLGHTLVVVSDEIRRDGERFCRWLEQEKVVVADCTPSLLLLLLEAGLGNDAESALTHILVGGEALPSTSVAEFYRRKFARRTKITNVYGPTECCVDVTAYTVNPDALPAQTVVPLGQSFAGHSLRVWDEAGHPVPIGVPGELWIAGPGVGRGYLRDPELTARKFVRRADAEGKRFYASGDKVRWNDAGLLEFLGRNDEQFKIRGFRVEPGEIESRLQRHPAVRSAAVTIRTTTQGAGELNAYLVLHRPVEFEELRRFAAEHLPDYMLPARFLVVDDLPLNSSGKVNRHALPAPEAARQLDVSRPAVAPRDERERALAEVWAAVLERRPIGIFDHFFHCGGDSIKALQVVARLRAMNWKLELRDLFQHPILAELAPSLTLRTVAGSAVSEASASTGPIPPTAIQQWFFDTFDGAPQYFNQAVVLEPLVPLADETICTALESLRRHHDALRLVFHRTADGWRQEPADAPFAPLLTVVDLRAAADWKTEWNSALSRLHAAGDLQRNPLRAARILLPQGRERLVLVAHHLAVDGVSWRILVEDFAAALRALCAKEPLRLPERTTSFAEWAGRVRSFARSETFLAADFWRKTANEDKGWTPSCDFPEGTNAFADLADETVCFSREETRLFAGEAHRAYNTGPDDLLLTAWARTVAKQTGIHRTAVEMERHGREPLAENDPSDLSRTVGWFTAMFPVCTDLSCADEIGAQIKRVKELLRRIPRQGIGYGILRYLTPTKLREGMQFAAVPAVRLNYLGKIGGEFECEFFRRASEDPGMMADPKASRGCEWEIRGWIVADRLEIVWSYSRSRWKKETIAAWLRVFAAELSVVVRHAAEKQGSDLTPSDVDYDGFDVDGMESFLNQFDR